MTVEVQTKKVTANGNDVATTFSFSPIVIFESGNLVVTKKDSDDVETVLSEGSSSTTYSVSVSSYPGTGSITYPASGGTPLATGETITIKRVLTIEQALDLENQGGYFADNQETQFDKLVMIDLQQQEELDRTLKLPVSSTADPELPAPVANAYLRWNTNADGLEAASLAATDGEASDDAPQAVSLSAADAGVGADYSRSDHVHLLPTVSVAKGGTGATTAAGARTNLGLVIGTDVQDDVITTRGDIVRGSSSGAAERLAIGAAGTVLTSDGTDVSWGTGVPTGTMLDYAGAGAVPTGYLACDGSNVSRTTYAALFAVLDETWGAGDGSTTFGLPDSRRSVSVGSGGTGTGTLGNAVGDTGGEESHVQTLSELRAHSHTVATSTADTAGASVDRGDTADGSVNTSSVGSSSGMNVMQPSYVVQKIIKT